MTSAEFSFEGRQQQQQQQQFERMEGPRMREPQGSTSVLDEQQQQHSSSSRTKKSKGDGFFPNLRNLSTPRHTVVSQKKLLT